MITWTHPEWWAVLIAALLATLGHAVWRRIATEKLGDERLWKTVRLKSSSWRYALRSILALSAIMLGIFALANPRQGSGGEEEVERMGLDLIFAVDLSRSMLAEDVQPSRLERAKQVIRQTINAAPGDRIGVITYAGNAYPQLPLTTDQSAALLSLQTVHPDFIETQGSEVQSAVELSLELFDLTAPQDKALLILSDGEDHGSGWEEAIRQAVSSGIHVFTIGFGTESGGPIPSGSRSEEFHRDQNGEVVITRRDNRSLTQMADMGKGSLLNGNSGDCAEELMRQLSNLERVSLGTVSITAHNDQYQLPLGIALILLLIRTLITERRSERLTRWLEN